MSTASMTPAAGPQPITAAQLWLVAQTSVDDLGKVTATEAERMFAELTTRDQKQVWEARALKLNEMSGASDNVPAVLVTVSGGCAEVVACDRPVKVVLVDYDNAKNGDASSQMSAIETPSLYQGNAGAFQAAMTEAAAEIRELVAREEADEGAEP